MISFGNNTGYAYRITFQAMKASRSEPNSIDWRLSSVCEQNVEGGPSVGFQRKRIGEAMRGREAMPCYSTIQYPAIF